MDDSGLLFEYELSRRRFDLLARGVKIVGGVINDHEGSYQEGSCARALVGGRS